MTDTHPEFRRKLKFPPITTICPIAFVADEKITVDNQIRLRYLDVCMLHQTLFGSSALIWFASYKLDTKGCPQPLQTYIKISFSYKKKWTKILYINKKK